MAQVFCLGEALIDRLLPWGDDPAAIVWVVRRPMGLVPWRGWERLLALLDAWAATPSVQPLQNSLSSEAWIPAVCSGMSSVRAGWCWWSVMPAVIAALAALMATAGQALPIRPWPPISCQLGWEAAGWLAAPFPWPHPLQLWRWSRPSAGIVPAGALGAGCELETHVLGFGRRR